MKKKGLLFAITISSLTLSACNNDKEKNGVVKFQTGNYYNKNWVETAGTYMEDVIPDMDTAVEIAQAIFNGMNISKKKQEYVPQFVFYDEQEEIWIVSFWKNTNENVLGADCNIALKKKDGGVVRIWFGE